jgi:ABC-type Fe3+/spermidine/putrescine transport system ATPase subunit
MLELRALSKRFQSLRAVDDVSLSIQDGEFFALLGPSGCGKTTLLRMIAGLEIPSAGEIHHDGRRIEALEPNERHFNMVFQRYALFPHLTVAENVAFGLRMKKVEASEIRTRVEEALALVRLAGFEDRRIGTLSGGQGQRVALARALVNRPRILLLDEPLSALDLKLRQQMQVELLSIQRRLGHTFIFVTHDQQEALTLSDRVAVMNAGKVEQLGSPREIYDSPKTEFVASFIGTTNLVPAERIAWARERARPGSDLKVLIRPEKISLSPRKSGEEARAGQLAGTIAEVLFQGPFSQVLVDCEGVLVTVSQTGPWEVGTSVWVTLAEKDCRLSEGGRVL